MAQRVDPNIFIEYDYSVFDEIQEDLGEKVEWLDKTWYLTPNQRLEELGFDASPDPNMDKIFMPSGLIPIEESSLEVEEVDEEEIGGENS